jgi:hypothetical protein
MSTSHDIPLARGTYYSHASTSILFLCIKVRSYRTWTETSTWLPRKEPSVQQVGRLFINQRNFRLLDLGGEGSRIGWHNESVESKSARQGNRVSLKVIKEAEGRGQRRC